MSSGEGRAVSIHCRQASSPAGACGSANVSGSRYALHMPCIRKRASELRIVKAMEWEWSLQSGAPRATPCHSMCAWCSRSLRLMGAIPAAASRRRRNVLSLLTKRWTSAWRSSRRPVEPADLVVLAVGVVVAALRAPDLVAHQQHRRAGGDSSVSAKKFFTCRLRRRLDRRVLGRPLDAAVPALVLVRRRRGCPRRWPRCACAL